MPGTRKRPRLQSATSVGPIPPAGDGGSNNSKIKGAGRTPTAPARPHSDRHAGTAAASAVRHKRQREPEQDKAIDDCCGIIKNLCQRKGIPADRIEGILSVVQDIASTGGLVNHIARQPENATDLLNKLYLIFDEKMKTFLCQTGVLGQLLSKMEESLQGVNLLVNAIGRDSRVVQTEEARHLYRNFADSTDDLEVALSLETPDKPLRLRLSRREVDIMLYSVSKGQTAMDCHYLMPYRSRRKMREVYESIRMLFGDVKEEYMANIISTVEALIAIEGPAAASRREDTQSVIEMDLI